jgi:hypothetical protein
MIAALLALTFVFYLPIAVWSLNFQREGLQAETWLDPLAEQNFYENVIPYILPILAEPPPDPNGNVPERRLGALDFNVVVDNLDQSEWEMIAREVVPPDFVQSETEKNLPLFLNYITGQNARLEAEFDTYILRDNLLGQPGDRMINLIFNSWPACDATAEAEVQAFLDEVTETFPYCKPQDAGLQREIFSLLKSSKDDLATKLPDVWNIREEYATRNELTLAQVDDVFYQNLQWPIVLATELYLLNYMLAASLLAMIVIFAVASFKSFLRWMGIPILLAGILTLIPLGVGPLLFSSPPQNDVVRDEVVALREEAIRGVLASLVSTFTTPVLIQGAVIVAVGFLFLLISTVVEDDDDLHTAPIPYDFMPPTFPPAVGSTPTGGQTLRPNPPPLPKQPPPMSSPLPAKRKRDEAIKVEAQPDPRRSSEIQRSNRLSINVEAEEDPPKPEA